MTDCLLRKAAAFEADEIKSGSFEGITGSPDVRGDILGHPVATSNDGMASDFNELVNGHNTPDNSVIMDLRVPSHIHNICKYNVVTDPAVVGDMDVGHQKTVAPDDGFIAVSCTAMKAAKLPYDVSIPDLESGRITLIFEILGSIT